MLLGDEFGPGTLPPITILQQITATSTVIPLYNTPSNGISGELFDMVQGCGVVWAAWPYYSLNGGPPSSAAVTQIAQDGTITAYAIPSGWLPAAGSSCAVGSPTPYGTNQDITIGPDGVPWVALLGTSGSAGGQTALARVANGTITIYPVSSNGDSIAGIATGALWFTEACSNQIGRMTTSGAVTQYPIPTSQAGPGRIIAGPNRTLWFTEVWANKIGRITY